MTSEEQGIKRVSQFQKQMDANAKAKQNGVAPKADGLKGKPALLLALVVATLALLALNVLAAFSDDGPNILTEDSTKKASVAPLPRQDTAATKIAPEGALITAQREKALEALELLSEKWGRLEAMSPALWAADEYSAASALYKSGDEAYAGDDFVKAKLLYEQTLSATSQLIETSTSVLDQAMDSAAQSLAAKDYPHAQNKFELAQAIAPDNIQAAKGLNSALQGAAVDRLMVKAVFYKDSHNFSQASKLLNEALELDPTRHDAQTIINELGQDESVYRLSRLISGGNEKLSSKQFDEAISLFNQALKMAPSNKDAQSGKELALQEKKSHTLAGFRVEGIRAEAKEHWSEAINAYQSALNLDSAAHFASEGLARAQRFKKLDDEMTVYLNAPKRLSSPPVYAAANTLFLNISTMDDAPSGLSLQNTQLGQILDTMQAAIPVRVLSDNRSTVSIQKIGALGKFNDKTIDLRAGRYVFIAKRKGYADKRVIVDIPADATTMLLKVMCDEKI